MTDHARADVRRSKLHVRSYDRVTLSTGSSTESTGPSSLERAAMFAPNATTRVRPRWSQITFLLIGFVLTALSILTRASELWSCLLMLDLVAVYLNAPQLPSGPARRKECGR